VFSDGGVRSGAAEQVIFRAIKPVPKYYELQLRPTPNDYYPKTLYRGAESALRKVATQLACPLGAKALWPTVQSREINRAIRSVAPRLQQQGIAFSNSCVSSCHCNGCPAAPLLCCSDTRNCSTPEYDRHSALTKAHNARSLASREQYNSAFLYQRSAGRFISCDKVLSFFADAAFCKEESKIRCTTAAIMP